MKLTLSSVKEEKAAWDAAGVSLPEYDIEEVRKNTNEAPEWLHFGAGNIFRGFIAGIADKLITEGKLESGIVAADSFDGEIIDKIYYPYDLLTLSIGLRADGNSDKKVTAGIGEALAADSTHMDRLKQIAAAPSLKMISFTITEKGYACTDISGKVLPFVEKDIEEGPSKPATALGIVTDLLYERYISGKLPIALVSMDNCSQNGKKLRDGIVFMAENWVKRGFLEEEFIGYISDESIVSFPWSMIDKITPRPDDGIAAELANLGIEDMNPIITERKTFIAPFVNAEIPQYLVVEDRFPNGRPPLEDAGVYMTDRDTVNKAEKMKVMTCLNPLHTALAVCGCLLGFNRISDEMKDEDLRKLVYKLGDEGMPVVVSPGIIDPSDFIKEVLEERLPNPYIPDTPQRIATDTSQKVAIRFGETIKGYMAKNECSSMNIIPFVLAAWFRYLIGLNDSGEEMNLSPDPMIDVLKSSLEGIELGNTANDLSKVKKILDGEELLGVSLKEAGDIEEKVINYLKEMLQGPGAVRKTLHNLVNQ